MLQHREGTRCGSMKAMPLFDSDFLSSSNTCRWFRGGCFAVRCWPSGGRCSSAAGSSSPIIASTRPGDDLRYLDWNIYARHGDLLLKRFQEEEDLHVYFLLDCSRSMGLASRRSSTWPGR